jgi:hypothetical protein
MRVGRHTGIRRLRASMDSILFWHCRVDISCGMMSLLSHAGDDAAESMSSLCYAGDDNAELCWQWRFRVGCGRGVRSPPSNAGDDAAKSCWQWHCQVGSGHALMSLLSHAGDDAVESCWRWCCRVGVGCM